MAIHQIVFGKTLRAATKVCSKFGIVFVLCSTSILFIFLLELNSVHFIPSTTLDLRQVNHFHGYSPSSLTKKNLIIKWLKGEGISTKYSSEVDMVRQLAARMAFYGEEIAPSEISKLTTDDIWELFIRSKVNETSFTAKRFLNLITRESEYVYSRLDSLGWKNVPRWSSDNGGRDVAIVNPFHADELSKIQSMLESWKIYPPCENFPFHENISIHFVWAFSGDFSSDDGRVTKKTLHRLTNEIADLLSCFASVNYMSLRQPSTLEHLDGACTSFHVLMHMFQNTPIVAFQLMETDVRPIRKGWVGQLVRTSDLANVCTNWWMKGSPSLCSTSYAPPTPIDIKRDYHMNGNSLYALNCPDFDEFLVQTQKFYPPRPDKGWSVKVAGGCETGRMNEGGYDHIMYEYRFEVENFAYARFVMDKFVTSYFLSNFCEDFYVEAELQDLNSQIFLVHSKSVQLSKFARLILNIFSETLKRPATVTELDEVFKVLVPLLYSGEIDDSDVKRLAISAGNQMILPPIDTKNWEKAFPDELYLWTSDFHTGPINCQMPIFRDLGVVTHAEIDFGNCIFSGYCKKRLRVLSFDDWRGFSLESGGRSQEKLISDFYDVYKNDPEFARVDAFICSHPVANCQVFMPFNKPLIIYATTRFEFGRHDGGVAWRLPYWNKDKGAKMWKKWLQDFQVLAASPKNIIAANNLYDVNYIEYFTGIRPVLIESWCGDLNYEFDLLRSGSSLFQPYPSYLPTKNTFLIGAYRTNLHLLRNGTKLDSPHQHFISKSIFGAFNRELHSFQLAFMQDNLKEMYSYADLCKYQGIIVIPYQVSTISIMEFYRLNIPLFFPSKELLKTWHTIDDDFLWERTYGWPETPWSTFHFKMDPEVRVPNPNSNSPDSFSFWINFCDWYHLPNIQLFESVDHLIELLETVDLVKISLEMRKYNQKERIRLLKLWSELFLNMKQRMHLSDISVTS